MMQSNLLQVFLAFFKVGMFTFGGGYAMIPLIEREIIRNRGWLTPTEFVDMIAIAEMTPGPIAVNTATFVGYRLGGVLGSAVSTVGVVLPSAIIVLAAAVLVSKTRTLAYVDAAFKGIRPAVVGLVAYAGLSVLTTSVADLKSAAIAAVTLGLLASRRVHPILIIALAGLLGGLLF